MRQLRRLLSNEADVPVLGVEDLAGLAEEPGGAELLPFPDLDLVADFAPCDGLVAICIAAYLERVAVVESQVHVGDFPVPEPKHNRLHARLDGCHDARHGYVALFRYQKIPSVQAEGQTGSSRFTANSFSSNSITFPASFGSHHFS